ncbi:MAG: PilZ domain-containing protein [Deltaproteobacteria bacterium]|nr:PilZ domain-containing protein [Deltaproteobacteria bacterium]
MQENKFEKRIDDRKPVDILLNKYMADEPYTVRAADISTNGMYLHKLIEPGLEEGSMVSLEFQLPNSNEVIWARGTVMRESKRWGCDGVGIWFTIVPQTYRKQIEDFVMAA